MNMPLNVNYRAAVVAAFLSLYTLYACDANRKTANESAREFYPIEAYVLEELRTLDSLPLAVTLFRQQGIQSDTQIIDKSLFRRFALEMVRPDISKAPLRDAYQETVLFDQTLNQVTMMYQAKESSLPIRKLEIYLQGETDQVKSFYMERLATDGLQKIIWTGGKQVQVVTAFTGGQSSGEPLVEKYVWGFTD